MPHVSRVQRRLVVHVLRHHRHPVGQALRHGKGIGTGIGNGDVDGHGVPQPEVDDDQDDLHDHHDDNEQDESPPECRHRRQELQPPEFLPVASTRQTRREPSSGERDVSNIISYIYIISYHQTIFDLI